MNKDDLPAEFLELLDSVTNKRARIVIDHILEHGQITTEELETVYGYSHPPRAARDVREHGIPLETFRVKSTDGRTIAAYRFGDFSQIRSGRLGGRQAFPKQLKTDLFELVRGHCAICSGQFEERYLQIDHRIPYQIGGEEDHFDLPIQNFMLLCSTCNRAKSWSCEHCVNWADRDPTICMNCYWASPQRYDHVATRNIRRTDILWDQDEVSLYERIVDNASIEEISVPEFIKEILRKAMVRGDE